MVGEWSSRSTSVAYSSWSLVVAATVNVPVTVEGGVGNVAVLQQGSEVALGVTMSDGVDDLEMEHYHG